MIKHIKPLPISEELLGAYLEGNLTQNDAQYIEQMLQENDELSAFVNELSVSDDLTSNYDVEEFPGFENDFTLPDIASEIGTYLEPHIPPFLFEPAFVDVASCAVMPDITDDGDIITNEEKLDTTIGEDLNFRVDIDSEVLPDVDEL